jgi:hypothetical protein
VNAFLSSFANEDKKKRKVNSGLHTLLLDAPGSPKDIIGNGLHIANCGCFDLRQVSAEVTDYVSAFEIWRKALERVRPLALRTCTSLHDDGLTLCAELLTDSSQIRSQ